MNSDDIKRILSRARRRLKWHQNKVAKYADLHQSVISRYESGAGLTPIDNLQKWAEHLGYEIRIMQRPYTTQISTLVKTLKDTRLAIGWSGKHCAFLMDWDHSFLIRKEQGIGFENLAKILRWINALGYNLYLHRVKIKTKVHKAISKNELELYGDDTYDDF